MKDPATPPHTAAEGHSLKPLAPGLVPVVAWGASFIATKVLLLDLPGGAIVWLRFGIGTMVLAGEDSSSWVASGW